MDENNQPTDLIENALLQQFIQQGDDDAFSKLQLLLRSRLQGYAYKLLRDSHRAEDTVQESFLKLYQQREPLQKALAGGRSITVAWLFTTARHSAIDELRKIGLHKETSFESLKEEGKDPEIQGTSVSENPARHPHDYSNLGLQPPPSSLSDLGHPIFL